MSDLHIDDFCKDTAKVFIFLYSRFPVKSILQVEDISGPDTPDEFGLHSPRHQACFSAMIWLAENGYLNYGQMIRREALEDAVLSHMGFALLTSIEPNTISQKPGDASEFSSLESNKSKQQSHLARIHMLKEDLKNGHSEKLKTRLLQYFHTSKSFR